MERILDEWLRRVAAEYQSAAAAQNYTLWLIQAGASPDLIRDGLRVVDDEIEHADLSHQVYVEAGGTETPHIPQETLELPRLYDNLYEDLLEVALRFFALGETVAVPLFQRMRKNCSQTKAREALDRILVDEVRHRDFGWDLLDWLVNGPEGERMRVLLQQWLPIHLGNLLENYGADPEEREISDEDRQWGLIPGAEYADILQRCLERDYRPRFARIGIELPADLRISPA